MIKATFLLIIRIYQKTLSPDHGLFSFLYPSGYCKHQPTCSSYAYLAISKHGALKGLLMGISRVFRCNPWSKGGFDPVK